MKHRYFFLILLVILLSGCQNQASDLTRINQNNPSPAAEATVTPSATPPVVLPVKATSTPKTESVPTKPVPPVTQNPNFLDYPVAFAGQAPYGNWDALHEEACEEAAMIMADKYFKKEPLAAHVMEQEILNLVKWETGHGYSVDVTVEEATTILKTYFSLSAQTVTDASVANIKKELLAGNLIIIPAAGRLLGNPNFTAPGPIYHMLVIRGYDEKNGEFITNDPGTRKGEGYRYKYSVIINAIHDWNHQLAEGGMTDLEMSQGRKVMIVVSK